MAGVGAGATVATARIFLAALPSAATCKECIEYVTHRQECETSQPWQRLQCRMTTGSGASLAIMMTPSVALPLSKHLQQL